MLLRLYEPILWRSLHVANAQVRRNAAALLVEAFPLQNPEASQREIDELLQAQFEKLQARLYLAALFPTLFAISLSRSVRRRCWTMPT